MEQVPLESNNFDYLIIGSGKLAKHFGFYFNLLNIPFLCWDRSLPISDLDSKILKSRVVLLMISDDAIVNFYNEHLACKKRVTFHFSGALFHPSIYGIHPLTMFGDKLWSEAVYQQIPFVCDHEDSFYQFFPKLTNKAYTLDPKKKSLYHSLCVMAGNFTTLLWSEVRSELQNECDLSYEILMPYLGEVFNNISREKMSFTGPLERSDRETINKNLTALKSLQHKEIYKSFMNLRGIHE